MRVEVLFLLPLQAIGWLIFGCWRYCGVMKPWRVELGQSGRPFVEVYRCPACGRTERHGWDSTQREWTDVGRRGIREYSPARDSLLKVLCRRGIHDLGLAGFVPDILNPVSQMAWPRRLGYPVYRCNRCSAGVVFTGHQQREPLARWLDKMRPVGEIEAAFDALAPLSEGDARAGMGYRDVSGGAGWVLRA